MDGKGTAGRTPQLARGQRAIHGRVGTVSGGSKSCGRDVTRAPAGTVRSGQGALVPDASQPPEVWDALADAYATNGEPAKAGAEMVRAADRAAALGQAAAAAGYRLRGGGFLFQAGLYVDADKVLSHAADDPAAGPLRAKAAMLRCLARGRALASGCAGRFRGVIHDGARAAAPRFSDGSVDQRSAMASGPARRRRRRSPPGRNDLVGDRPRVAALARFAARHRRCSIATCSTASRSIPIATR